MSPISLTAIRDIIEKESIRRVKEEKVNSSTLC